MIRHAPILGWLCESEPAWFRADLIAGLTIMALVVPEGMAYAELAGVGPEAAFYAAPIGLLLYAVFGTSRQLVVAVICDRRDVRIDRQPLGEDALYTGVVDAVVAFDEREAELLSAEDHDALLARMAEMAQLASRHSAESSDETTSKLADVAAQIEAIVARRPVD